MARRRTTTMSWIPHVTGTAIAAALALGLAACSSDVTPEPVETSPVATAAPAPVETTEPAPVDDTPGQAPAIDAQIPDATTVASGWTEQANQVLDSGKYLIRITYHANGSGERDGFNWAVVKVNDYGNARVVESGPTVATIDEAAAGPFTLDGRTLDRAEYVPVIVTD